MDFKVYASRRIDSAIAYFLLSLFIVEDKTIDRIETSKIQSLDVY